MDEWREGSVEIRGKGKRMSDRTTRGRLAQERVMVVVVVVVVVVVKGRRRRRR